MIIRTRGRLGGKTRLLVEWAAKDRSRVIVVATQSVSILTDLILPADASGDLRVILVFAAMVLLAVLTLVLRLAVDVATARITPWAPEVHHTDPR